MCVIITKTKEQKKPSRDFLLNAWNTNPDGAGFMYVKNHKVYIEKGFMNFEKFYKRVKKLPENTAIVYHFRIATHGARGVKGTHPFPITNKDTLLQQQSVVTDIGVAHNGIISLTSNYTVENNKFNLSDTQLYIRDYLYELAKIPNWYHKNPILNLIDRSIGSKMTILTADNEVINIGNFITVDGYKCSNDYFKPRVYNYNDYDYGYDYKFTEYKLKLPIKELADTVFVSEVNNDEWYLLTDFETVEIGIGGKVFLNGIYMPKCILVDVTGKRLYQYDLKKEVL